MVEDHGLVLWNGQWFGGHSTPGYGLVAPALAAAIGVWTASALAIVVSAILFERLVRDRFGRGGRVAALCFAVGSASSVFSGRFTFAMGVAIGLAALVAAQKDGWTGIAGALGVLTTVTSPVAGAFLALAGTSAALVRRRRADVIVALAPVASGLALAAAFPESGTQPYGGGTLRPILLFSGVLLLALPRKHAVLRMGAALYAAAAAATFLVATPMGGNVARLGALFAAPIAVCGLWSRPVLLALLAVPLLSWQWDRSVRDVRAAENDPSTQSGYYAPLLRALGREHGPAGRLEIPTTHNHWEAAYVAPAAPLARGWERQVDRRVNGLFYRPGLTPATYHAWLKRLGVRWVAVPDARLEGASWPEAFLIRRGLPYLSGVWRNRHWRLFAVRDPTNLVAGPGRLTSLTGDSFTLHATRPGRVLVRIHWQPYWALAHGFGCVSPAGDWTLVEARTAERIEVVTAFALDRIGSRSPRCRTP
jgi:hypothetical protein